MRILIFLTPLLYLRGIVMFLLIVISILGLLFFFISHSPLFVEKLANKYAKEYHITYDDIEGNFLSGIKIINPRFKEKKIAKTLELKWNPNTLVTKTLTINKLQIKEGDADVIKGLIDSFATDENSSKDDTNLSQFDFAVKVNNIDISLLPFVQNNISFYEVILENDRLSYGKNAFVVDDLVLKVDTNITDILLEGSMKEELLTLSTLDLKDINILAVMALFASDENVSIEKDTTAVDEKKPNIFIPNILKIQNLQANALSFDADPINVKHIKINASEILFNVTSKVLESAIVDLDSKTNLADMAYEGFAKNNHLLGKINIVPKPRVYELYEVPLRKEAIANITIDFNASSEKIVADIKTKAKQILKGKKGDFNIDVEDLYSQVIYDFDSASLSAETKALLHTPYARSIEVDNTFVLDKKTYHHGSIKINNFLGIDEKLAKTMKNFKIMYAGDTKSIESSFTSESFNGTFDSKDFKIGKLEIETLKPLVLSGFVDLPKELKDTKANLSLATVLDFNNITPIDAKIKLNSNVINVLADVRYGKDVSVKGKIDIPKKSLLKAYSADVKWKSLSSIDMKVKLVKDLLSLKFKAKALDVDLNYALKKGNVKGKVNLGGLLAKISGNSKTKLKIKTEINSLPALGKNMSVLYDLGDLPPIEGKINLSVVIDKLQTAELRLVAPKLTYKADKHTKHSIKDVELVTSLNASNILVKSYKGTFNKQKYFSKKMAVITLGDIIKVDNFWINDELEVRGKYNTENKKGIFFAKADNFRIKDTLVDIQAGINIKIVLDSEDTSVIGKVVLLKGKITPDLEAGKSFARDSDIIILQEVKSTKKSPFMDNLSVSLKIESKEALRLKERSMNIRLKTDLTIAKYKGSDLSYLGSIELLNGCSYTFQKKRFVLEQSFVYFTGSLEKPILDIRAQYKSINHLITISVSGTPKAPNINFSSSPFLTREQILSVILFDTEAGGDSLSGNDMMKMMGGAMAKAALSDVGIAVDHLAFGEGNSVEIGKKITNKSTVIYVNDIIPIVKLRHQHNQHTESVFSVSEESQSYDIIFKDDF